MHKEQQHTISIRTMFEKEHMFYSYICRSHLHSCCASRVSSGLATRGPWLECHGGNWETLFYGGGRASDFIFCRSTWLFLSCVLNGTPSIKGWRITEKTQKVMREIGKNRSLQNTTESLLAQEGIDHWKLFCHILISSKFVTFYPLPFGENKNDKFSCIQWTQWRGNTCMSLRPHDSFLKPQWISIKCGSGVYMESKIAD